MQFVYPAFLWGLFAVSIPLIIHLFRLRRFKIVFFSNTELLRQIQLETRRKSRLKHLLVLLMRMLTIASVIIAFAQPLIPRKNTTNNSEGEQTVLIYLDNSFSMDIGESYYTMLQQAKEAVLKISKGFPQSERYIFLTNEFLSSSYRQITIKELQKSVESTNISSKTRTFSEVITRLKDIISQLPDKNVICFIVSDFQKSFFLHQTLHDSASFPMYFIPVTSNPVSNIGIDSLWLDSPAQLVNQQTTVSISVRNFSGEQRDNIPVELIVNQSRKALATCSLGPYQQTVVQVSFIPTETGLYEGHVKIQDNPLTYDDVMFFSFSISENISVTDIYQQTPHNSVKKLFSNDNYFRFNPVSDKQVTSDEISTSDLIILDQISDISSGLTEDITNALKKGATVCIIPSSSTDIKKLNMFLSASGGPIVETAVQAKLRIADIQSTNPLFRNVFDGVPKGMDLPYVNTFFPITSTGTSSVLPLLKLQNDAPFLVQYSNEKGTVYLFTSPFDKESTNFHRHSVFVPVLYQMALLSKKSDNIYYCIGGKNNPEINFSSTEKENRFLVTNTKKTINIIPEITNSGNRMSLFLHNQIDTSGNYRLFFKDSLLDGISLNYMRNESVLTFYNVSQLDSIAKNYKFPQYNILTTEENLDIQIKEQMYGVKLWRLFLFAALFFLLTETAILRLWK